MERKRWFSLAIVSVLIGWSLTAHSQDADVLIKKVREKYGKVNDYIAVGKMKTEVAFIKAPPGNVKIFYKKPDKFNLKREGGISILPKGGISFNISSILATGDFTPIASGESIIGGTKVKIIKLLPNSDNGDVILTTLYIDEKNLLIRKVNTTTRENGTFEMEMSYAKYAFYGLPDKVEFLFNTKDYKIPKGLTLEFETDDAPKQNDNKKGRVEILYSSYIINKGISDAEFK